MKRLALALAFAALLFAFGCDDGESVSSDVAATTAAYADKSFEITEEFLDTLDYEEFGGTLQPGMGGWLMGTMKTWPAGSNFTIGVPPEAISYQPYPVQFSMRIPTKASYDDCSAQGIDLPLIIRLEPSNMLFLENISVMATYMPWENVNLRRDDFIYELIDPDETNSGLVDAFLDKKLVRLIFSLPHFSDWEVSAQEED